MKDKDKNEWDEFNPGAEEEFRRLMWDLLHVGHPDDLAHVRAVLSLNGWSDWPGVPDLLVHLQVEEEGAREVLEALERVGWTYRREGVGKGSLVPIGGHPAHGQGRGMVPHLITTWVWVYCFEKEQAAREALEESDPPWAKYRVMNKLEFRTEIAEYFGDWYTMIPLEYLTDEAIKSAINSWLKRKGKPPDWMQSAE